MATQSAINVTPSGASAVATYTQTQNTNTVYVPQSVLVDATSGSHPEVDQNGLHVVPVLGTPNSSGVISASPINPNAAVPLTSTVSVTTGKTGTLQHAIFSGTQTIFWTLQTVNNAG